MEFALNHMTVPYLGYAAFLDLAAALGCVGVEVRNDIERPLFDGVAPGDAGKMAADRGLRLVGLSQVYPFNVWTQETESEVADLVAIGKSAGAETISLIPRNDGGGVENGARQGNLRLALRRAHAILEDAEMIALVEPLGFARSSLSDKTELVEAMNALGVTDRFRIVHDTFHHTLAGGGPIYPELTGIVHISAVADPRLAVGEMEDKHRVLVDERDRLGNIDQIRDLLKAGYDGVFSYECFSPEVHAIADPEADLRRSLEFIRARVTEAAPAEL